MAIAAEPSTRHRLLLAAEDLFATRGIDAVSLAEITKAAGGSNTGAIHHHFGGREELLAEIVDEHPGSSSLAGVPPDIVQCRLPRGNDLACPSRIDIHRLVRSHEGSHSRHGHLQRPAQVDRAVDRCFELGKRRAARECPQLHFLLGSQLP